MKSWAERKAHFDSLLTLFGRKPVAEALAADGVEPVCLHLARSNRQSDDVDALVARTEARGGEVRLHSRESLSRISKNRRQDQGVAIDIRTPTYQSIDALAAADAGARGLLAVDGITNPQNLGMIIRAVGAAPRDGLILARVGNAGIDGLVVKASAGTLFRTPIYYCDTLADALDVLRPLGFGVLGLSGEGRVDLRDATAGKQIFVLGNETHGLSAEVSDRCDDFVAIPMANGVESLNVAVAAGVVAFAPLLAARPSRPHR